MSLLGGMFLGNVDIAVVNVAIPSVRAQLQASPAELELIVSGYTLAYAMLLITSARVGQNRGRRGAYLAGLVVFTVSSLACGLAPDAPILVGARIVQGLGAALMVSQVLTEIQVNFEGQARRRALGAYTAVLGCSSVIGQVLGGVLVSADLFGTGWRPIFLINVPVAAVLVVLSLVYLPRGRPDRSQQLDLPGVGLLSLGLLLLVTPLMFGGDLGWPLWTWLCLLACVPVLVVFVFVERGVAARDGGPLINVHLLALPSISLALVSQASVRAGYFALLFVFALYLQQGLGASATYSGLIPIAFVATFAMAGPILGRLGPDLRRHAGPTGGLLMAVCFAGIAATVAVGVSGTITLVVLLGIGGFGYGLAFSGTLAQLTDAVEPRYAPDVSGLFNTTLQVGGSLGVAVFGAVYLGLSGGGSTPPAAFAITCTALAALSLIAALFFGLSSHSARTKQTTER